MFELFCWSDSPGNKFHSANYSAIKRKRKKTFPMPLSSAGVGFTTHQASFSWDDGMR